MIGPESRYREHFGTLAGTTIAPRFNVAPSQLLPVVRRGEGDTRDMTSAYWGLIPSWVKEPKKLTHPINAKAETAAIKPMFRHAFRKSRILVPADAFYEWKVVTGGKQPYLIRTRDESPLGFAGLMEYWHGPEGVVQTFAILTTEPNVLMAEIHKRMPAIIQPEAYTAWLDPDVTDVEALQSMLAPYPERLMEAYPVSRKVNSPANDGPDLIKRVEEGR